MDKSRISDQGKGEGLGPELEGLLAKVPPPKAPAWFAAKTLARIRQEKAEDQRTVSSWMKWRWIWAAGTAGLVAGWVLWDRPKSGPEISDAMVFAALDALVEQEEEIRWWAGL